MKNSSIIFRFSLMLISQFALINVGTQKMDATNCQKELDATELMELADSVPNVFDGLNNPFLMKWLQKYASGILCHKNFNSNFELINAKKGEKWLLNNVKEISAAICGELKKGKNLENAAENIEKAVIKFAQHFEGNGKIKENIQNSLKDAKKEIEKIELKPRNNFENYFLVETNQIIENAYVGFEELVKAIEAYNNKKLRYQPNLSIVKQMQSFATVLLRQSLATATVETTAGRRRRRKRMRSLNIEQQTQAREILSWKCRFVLAFAVLTFATLLFAITLFLLHQNANNRWFILIAFFAFVLSQGTYILCCSSLCN
ncbi:hypothetical protein GPALN_016297 [Globodera pallida]|nr:hypothetical protein GPALN_016297 [Globodera pallida]